MKSALFLCGVLAALASPAWPQQPTRDDRNQEMSHMHATRKLFLDSVAGLTDAQWRYKAAPDRWSIAEVAEHIAVSEDTLFGLVTKQILSTPADPSKAASVKGKEAAIEKNTPDRSTKFQAPEMLRPTNRWPDSASLVAHFKESRDRNIAYMDSTTDGLREHFFEHPAFGLLDAYQWLLFISAHSERHTAQILEVKNSPGFPK